MDVAQVRLKKTPLKKQTLIVPRRSKRKIMQDVVPLDLQKTPNANKVSIQKKFTRLQR